MIDIETPLTLSQAAKLPTLAVNGRRPHSATIWRWASNGVRGVKLHTHFVGGCRVTTAKDVAHFLSRLNGDDSAESLPTPRQRQREIDAADRALDALGIR